LGERENDMAISRSTTISMVGRSVADCARRRQVRQWHHRKHPPHRDIVLAVAVFGPFRRPRGIRRPI
jgi:hypothetical protein